MEGLEAVILSMIKPVWIEELKDKMMGHFNIPMHEMIDHLCNHGGDVNTCNKAAMMEEKDCP